jgi:(E)-4-hydroxy-3-methylbut-2-enyl-diphosphate synthase
MVKVDPHDPEAIARQADELAEMGAGLVRLAIPDRKAADAIAEVRRRSRATLVADIHFDPRLALAAIEAGAHKIRVNPGNLHGGAEAVTAIARAASEKGIPIRVGANSGSLKQPQKAREPQMDADGRRCKGEHLSSKRSISVHQRSSAVAVDAAVALASSVLDAAAEFERAGFRDIVLSAKGSDVLSTVEAGRMLAKETDYPIHVGVTAAGPPSLAWAKSAVGIGTLLVDGIGDTIRVSYTGDPKEEVSAGLAILDAVGLGRTDAPDIISCPTCGRTRVDLVRTVDEVRKALNGLSAPVRIAIMGCEVNGPGEAREADVGVACGRGGGWLFAKGEKLRRVDEKDMVSALVDLAGKVAAKSQSRQGNRDMQDGQDGKRQG